VHFAAQAVLSGTAELVMAGGVQNMSQVPISAAMTAGRPLGHATPFAGSRGWARRYGDQEVSQFHAAEAIAERWGIGRAEMEAYALRSHARAVAAVDEGRFAAETTPYGGVRTDEGPRRDTTAAKMAALVPLTPGGRLTAATSSQISDAAAALLIASPQAVRDHRLTPRARILHLSARAADPLLMLTAPIPATARALARTGLTIDDLDLIEINEAFASVVLAWLKETGADPGRVNVNRGAIALGHPLGATGARQMTTLLYELERRRARYGLQTMCEGGGQANVTIIERL
jgi:acetyl-CoA C-acetyltransferase